MNVAEELIGRLSASGKLPTPPGVVMKILDLTSKANTSVVEITEAIALDPALSAKILRYVNSPMSGVTREVTALKQAVALMGVRGVKMMALSFSVLSSSKDNQCASFDSEHFSIHSIACAAAAKALAEISNTVNPQDAFSAGLLCQLGRSILASSLPKEYANVIRKAQRIPADLPPLEQEVFGETYATVGGAILKSWNLPEALYTAVARFRDPLDKEGLSPLTKLLALAEMAADLVCPHGSEADTNPTTYLSAVKSSYGISDEGATSTLRQIASEVDAVRAILKVGRGSLRSPEDIENDVRERIAELSLAMHMENQNMAAQQEELMRRATTDSLTGIGNRAAFDARLELELERALREGGPLALMMIDVDHFKKFNDAYGHQVGDKVLQAVARALDENIRKVDFAARYGGEEFAVIAPRTAPEHAVQLAERLRKGISVATVQSDQGTLNVTASVGVAVIFDASEPSKDALQLIKTADALLYQAKCSGRNRVEFDAPSRQTVSN